MRERDIKSREKDRVIHDINGLWKGRHVRKK